MDLDYGTLIAWMLIILLMLFGLHLLVAYLVLIYKDKNFDIDDEERYV